MFQGLTFPRSRVRSLYFQYNYIMMTFERGKYPQGALLNWSRLCSARIMQCADYVVCRLYSLQIMPYADYAVCRLCRTQIMPYADYTVCKLYSMQIMSHAYYASCALCVLCQMSAKMRVPEIGMHHVQIIWYYVYSCFWQKRPWLYSLPGGLI